MSSLDKIVFGRITLNSKDSHSLGRGTIEALLKRAAAVLDKTPARDISSIHIDMSRNELVKPPSSDALDPVMAAFAGLDIPLATPEEEAAYLAVKDRNADPLFQTYLRGLNMRVREQMVGDEWRVALNHVKAQYPDIWKSNEHLTR